MNHFYESFLLIHIPVNKFRSKLKDFLGDRVCYVLRANLCYANL